MPVLHDLGRPTVGRTRIGASLPLPKSTSTHIGEESRAGLSQFWFRERVGVPFAPFTGDMGSTGKLSALANYSK